LAQAILAQAHWHKDLASAALAALARNSTAQMAGAGQAVLDLFRTHDDLKVNGLVAVPSASLAHLLNFCRVSDQAIQTLIDLSTHRRNGDAWTPLAMRNYIKFTWIRLLEQSRIQFVMLPHERKGVATAMGVTLMYFVANTGLVDGGDQYIHIAIMQSTSARGMPRPRGYKPFILTAENVLRSHDAHKLQLPDGRDLPKLETLLRYLPHHYPYPLRSAIPAIPPRLEPILDPPTFISNPCLPSVVFCPLINIDYEDNLSHILLDGILRFVAAGVFDIEELMPVFTTTRDSPVVGDGGDGGDNLPEVMGNQAAGVGDDGDDPRGDQAAGGEVWNELAEPEPEDAEPPQGYSYKLWCDEDRLDYDEGAGNFAQPPKMVTRDGREQFVWFLQYRNGELPRATLTFRRGYVGIKALQQKLRSWIQESISLCRKNFALALPQMYYTVHQGKFQGSGQILLPLFCHTQSAKLALALSYSRGQDGQESYRAATVLSIRMARGNARLITTPQVSWISQPPP